MPGNCSLRFSQDRGWPCCVVVTLRGLFGMAAPCRLPVVCVHTHPTHSGPAGRRTANLAGEGARRVEGKFWKILKVSAVRRKSGCL